MSFLRNLGKKKVGFEFSFMVAHAKDVVGLEGKGVVCQIKRKDKNLQTRVSLVGADKSVTWNERLDFHASMYSDKKPKTDQTVYESKPYSLCICDAQGTEMYKVDLDLASLLQHEQQTESVQHLALAPAHASTKSAVSAAGFSTASASGGAGDASAGPRLRVIAWSCHESVPVSSRMYNAATRAASGSTASLDDDRFGRSSDASQVPGFGRASSLQLQAEAAELKGEVSPVLKSAAAAGAAAKPAISGSASAGAGAGAGDAGDARAERHRKISVMFGQVMAGQPRADGAASYSAASASAGASGGGDTPGAEDGQTSPQDGSAGGAGVAERKPAKRDRNRFASMDVSNMVSERRNADLDAATEAIRNMSVREGEEDPFGDDDDGEGEGLAAQRAYTKSTRDRGFERFLANDGDGAGHRNLAED